MTQLVLEHLDPAIWNATLPAKPPTRTRTIVAVVTHLHNVRAKWIRLSAPHLGVPAQLHRAHCTQEQARVALAESATVCAQMLAEALSPDSKIQYFRRDALAKPWPLKTGDGEAAALQMLAYMLTHEAHHRGQICMLAHQLGAPLPGKLTAKLWNWDQLAKFTK